MPGSECASYGSSRLLLRHRAILEDTVTRTSVNLAVGTVSERGGTTVKEDIDHIGGDIGVGLHQKIGMELAREDTGGGMSRSMSGPSIDGEIVTMSAITRDGVDRILAREAGLREMDRNVIPGVVGGAMDDHTSLGRLRALDPDLLNALRGDTKRTVIDEMNIAARLSIGLLTGPANIREDLRQRQQTGTRHQITTQIHWRT